MWKKTLMLGVAMAALAMSAAVSAAAVYEGPSMRETAAVVKAVPADVAVAPIAIQAENKTAIYGACDASSPSTPYQKSPAPGKSGGKKKCVELSAGPGDEPDGGDAGTPPGIRLLRT